MSTSSLYFNISIGGLCLKTRLDSHAFGTHFGQPTLAHQCEHFVNLVRNRINLATIFLLYGA